MINHKPVKDIETCLMFHGLKSYLAPFSTMQWQIFHHSHMIILPLTELLISMQLRGPSMKPHDAHQIFIST
jgi:hypothetical protein